MVDRFLSRQGVGIALVFMIAELSYINSKSLQFMFEGSDSLDIYFGVIGAVAFSIVTVLIMRLSNQEWLKICFPLFDTALVFCGLNLHHSHDLLANPVRFAMSIFLSVFSGLITFSLGQINAVQHNGNSEADNVMMELKSKLKESELNQLESNRIIDELTTKQNESICIIADAKRKTNDTLTLLNDTKTIADQFLRNHILYEAWMSKKRSETNRNGFDKEVSLLADKLKQGHAVSIDDYLKLERN